VPYNQDNPGQDGFTSWNGSAWVSAERFTGSGEEFVMLEVAPKDSATWPNGFTPTNLRVTTSGYGGSFMSIVLSDVDDDIIGQANFLSDGVNVVSLTFGGSVGDIHHLTVGNFAGDNFQVTKIEFDDGGYQDYTY